MENRQMRFAAIGNRPAEHFTGAVRIDPLFDETNPARPRGASVTFEPGTPTAWHTHPLGQTLIVTYGIGRVQRWGGPVEEIRPGGVVWIPPGEKHWHGASPTVAMTNIAIRNLSTATSETGSKRSATSNTRAEQIDERSSRSNARMAGNPQVIHLDVADSRIWLS
jgi:quercetin dioxygenase-like cupin family protein